MAVIAEAARPFYLHHEFIELAEHPRELFIVRKTVQRAFE